MTELYQTAYQSRPPIIDGLLYAGAYILAGAPKIGKSFLVAQIAYHVSTGKALWDYEVHPGTVLYLSLIHIWLLRSPRARWRQLPAPS